MSFSPGASEAPGISIAVCVRLEMQVPVRCPSVSEGEIHKCNFAGFQVYTHIAKLQATI